MKIIFLTLIASSILFSSCEKSTTPTDPIHSEPTKLVLTLTDITDATKSASFTWSDAGSGAAPSIDTIKVTPGKTYRGSVTLFDSKKTDITSTIKNKADEHQFFFTPTNGVAIRMTVGINDKDSMGLPVGLDITVSVLTGAPASGALSVVLGHYDDIKKDGKTLSPESDIDIAFPVKIQ